MKTEKIVTVSENSYLLTNQAGQLVKAANSFGSKISITYGEYRLNAKSLLGIMSLGIVTGATVTLSASGPDAEEAVNALELLLQRDVY